MEPHEAVTKKKIKSIVSATDEYLKSLNIDKEVGLILFLSFQTKQENLKFHI